MNAMNLVWRSFPAVSRLGRAVVACSLLWDAVAVTPVAIAQQPTPRPTTTTTDKELPLRDDAGVLAVGARPEKVLDEAAGEGPAWDPRLGLLFSGSDGNIYRFDPQGKLHLYRTESGSNGLLFDHDGRLLICEQGHRRIARLNLRGRLEVLTAAFNGEPYNSPNDITVDSKGRIYFSDPRYGDRSDMKQVDAQGRPIEGVYRIDSNRAVTRIIEHEVDRPNGVLITPDDRYLYVADNNNNTQGGARKLWRFDLTPEGTVSPSTQKLIYDWGRGRGPDGMAIDERGRLYVAGGLNRANPPYETDEKPGGVYVFSPEGKLLLVIRIPVDEVTNCTFGGADRKTLYITAGGTLWQVRTRSAGKLPWPRS
jgi:gluconolactonase